jgi:hypothetical protein
MFELMRLGTELHPDDRAQVLRQYVYRWTTDNPQRSQAWAGRVPPRVRLLTDAEWLACTSFAVRKNGRLDRRARSCWSRHPDYPPKSAD